ncbi:beta-lactamase [Leptospira kobayashii]|uniref:beta-lactamase n=1 Tax=Leptospira kobayashii TaxID=1917830 RepID=A0ABN6KEZ2_9LEPT|nr:subclass B1 metallo-beta-lactamase [Leptospira kobayashii]BDA78450.1 beta-lactamase [Leptospira kobayashii]
MFLFHNYFQRNIFIVCLIIGSGFVIDCKSVPSVNRSNSISDSSESTISETASVDLIRVKENVWIHRSSGIVGGEKMFANGLVVITSKGIVIIDTPWTKMQTVTLIPLLKEKFQKEIRFVIISHAHQDRISGIDVFLQNAIPVYSTSLTAKEAEKNGFTKPTPKLDLDPRMNLGDTGIEVYYPGHGHTKDNIVVWLPNSHILFAGCLIKSLESKTLGYIKEANLDTWPMTAKNLLERYPDAEIVVPGHGDWGKTDLIRHTIRLLDENPKSD